LKIFTKAIIDDMKVAVLAPIAWRTPPENYGPWEQVASAVAEGMVAAGMDVTLFATADSSTAGTLSSVIDRPYGNNPDADAKVNECLHISDLMERSREFDIIHNHFDFLPLTYSKLIKTPMVTTIHGFSSKLIIPVYQKYNDHTAYVSISNSDRSSELEYIATVYNGINTSQFTFNDNPSGGLLFFGRIHPHKGTLEAIQIAKRTGRKLIIAGLIQDHAYWNEKILPSVDGEHIIYKGNCGPAERDRLLGDAAALLHPISFDEPFGLSVAEAMCCGTPVIAFNRGAMPELIVPGKTGYLVDDTEEAIEVVGELNKISRNDCRQQVINNFSVEKMTEDYLSVYHRILEG
jgi:glycosyltransferase involved in cell wall biosynthesis